MYKNMWTMKESSSDRNNIGERSNTVADTCNRLSQYLKERGSLGGLELAWKLETIGSDFTAGQSKTLYEKSAERRSKHSLMELFPQHAGVNCRRIGENVTFNAMYSDHAITEDETAPMTIFYGDKLFVFDNFPADKVNEILAMGDNICSSSKPKQPTKTAKKDLPMTRKTSFYRFMERRKERALARAPYQVNGGPISSSTKHEDDQLILKL